MAHKRSEAKIKDLMAATTLVTSFLGGIERAAQQNGASELDVYKLMNGSGHLSFDQMMQFSMFPHRVLPRTLIEAPDGGQIYSLKVVVDGRRTWRKALQVAAPDTPWGAWFGPVGGVWVELPPTIHPDIMYQEQIVLVNFGGIDKKVHIRDAVKWGEVHGLIPAFKRPCLAIAEHEPLLQYDLNAGKALRLLCADEHIVDNSRVSIGLKWYGHGGRQLFHYNIGLHGYLREDEWVAFTPERAKEQ